MEPRRSNGVLRALSKINAPLIGVIIGCLVLCNIIWTSLNTPVPQGLANVPTRHADNKVHIHDMNALTTTGNAEANREKVLILTPLARFYPGYWKNLVGLSYPHELIDVGFIVPSNDEGDKVLKELEVVVHELQTSPNKFRRVTILRQDTPSLNSQTEAQRHAFDVQKERRSHMSLARNSLVFTTMQSDTSWVLWLDSDIVESPPTLIQDLAFHNKDVIVANCWQKYMENGVEKERPYDFNSWIESDIAMQLAENMDSNDILLEGYGEMATYRPLMAHFRNPTGNVHDEMELDGVGGTALMVRSDVHRDGAMFPPFPFYHLIETEGFAKMVKRLGYAVWGLPNYVVWHYNE